MEDTTLKVAEMVNARDLKSRRIDCPIPVQVRSLDKSWKILTVLHFI